MWEDYFHGFIDTFLSALLARRWKIIFAFERICQCEKCVLIAYLINGIIKGNISL